MKHFKVKKLKVTKTSTDRVLVRAKPTPLAKALRTIMKPGFGETAKKPVKMPPNKRSVKERAEEKATELSRKEAARQRYRNEHNVDMTSCSDNLAQLPDMAKMHTVTFPNGRIAEVPAFTVTAMGEPLGITGVTVTRWVNKGMIPAPILVTSRGKVYGTEEARTIVRIIGDHQRSFRQYREEHDEVKNCLFKEIERIREGIYKPK